MARKFWTTKQNAELRAEISDYRDQFSGLCHTLSVGSEGRPEMTANDWRKRVDDGINWLTSPMIKRYETAETERDKLRAEIAERDARIADMTNCALKNIPADWRPGYAWTDDCAMNVLSEYVVEIQTKCERAEAELARVTKCLSKANDQAEHFERQWYLRGHELEEREAELARLRAQEPAGDRFNAKLDNVPAKVAG